MTIAEDRRRGVVKFPSHSGSAGMDEMAVCDCGCTTFSLVKQKPKEYSVLGAKMMSNGYKVFCSGCGRVKYPLFKEVRE